MYEDYYTIKTFIDIINDQAIPPEEFPNLLNLVEQMPEDSEEIANQIPSILEKNFIDFKMYFTASPKAATLDPLENFRVSRGVRHFNRVLKSC